MKKGVGLVLVLFLGVILLTGFVSAGWWSDFLGKISGKQNSVTGNTITGYVPYGGIHHCSTSFSNTNELNIGSTPCSSYSSTPAGCINVNGGYYNVVGCVSYGSSSFLCYTSTCSPPACSSFTYSDWSVCSSSGTQTRTVLTSAPSGCTGGSPVLSQTCDYISPALASSCSGHTCTLNLADSLVILDQQVNLLSLSDRQARFTVGNISTDVGLSETQTINGISISLTNITYQNYAGGLHYVTFDYHEEISTCNDSDGGLDYYVKGGVTVTRSVPSGSVGGASYSEDNCLNQILDERICAGNLGSSQEYTCPNGCSDGACIDIGNYVILKDGANFNAPGNIAEVGSQVSINYYMTVRKSQKNNVESNLTRVIRAPSGENYSVMLTKAGEYCYDDPYYDGSSEAICSFNFAGSINVSEEGKHYFLAINYNKLVLLGVKAGFFAERLVLDSKYSPGQVYGYYSEYNNQIGLGINYFGFTESRIESETLAFEDNSSAKQYIDGLINQITGNNVKNNLRFNIVEVDGNNAYIVKVESPYEGSIEVIFWQSDKYLLMFSSRSQINSNANITSDDLAKALTGQKVTYLENANFEDFSSITQNLIKDYFAKYPSTFSGDLSCLPNWECSLSPIVCPEYGQQNKICSDKNKCFAAMLSPSSNLTSSNSE